MAKGKLQVRLVKAETEIPVKNATVLVSQSVTEEFQNKEINLYTDSSGFTEIIELDTPDIFYSESYSSYVPYSTCVIKVVAEGYTDIKIIGTQILPKVTAMQAIELKPKGEGHEEEEVLIIPDSELINIPPKKKFDDQQNFISDLLSIIDDREVMIPSYVIVHLGTPDDKNAENLKVKFNDYIKNVCSCEIYATWSETAIRVNVYCIISFVLNRIYTEWYGVQGMDFHITNDSRYDQVFVKGRNTYKNIDRIVDLIFNTYIVIGNKRTPVLAKYCSGEEYIENGCLLKWQSKFLADKGLNPTEILNVFFGTEHSFARTRRIEGVPREYPGYPLGVGESGEYVKTVQTYLNFISEYYPVIDKIDVNGHYDIKTAIAVKKFQELFSLSGSGIVDFATWYSIAKLYVSLATTAENDVNRLRAFREGIFIPPTIDEEYGYIPIIKYPLE